MIIRVNNGNGSNYAKCVLNKKGFGDVYLLSEKVNIDNVYVEDVFDVVEGSQIKIDIDVCKNYSDDVLNDLLFVESERGYCSGIWEGTEYGRSEYVEDFLNNMLDMAKRYGVDVDDCWDDDGVVFNVGDVVNEDNYVVVEMLANDVYLKVKDCLLGLL